MARGGGQRVGPATSRPRHGQSHHRLPARSGPRRPDRDRQRHLHRRVSIVRVRGNGPMVLSIETLDGDYITPPADAPGGVWTGEARPGIDVSFEDDFQSDSGWAVSGDATAGQWGGGAQWWRGPMRPSADSDGSGVLRHRHGAGDTDIDGGSTTTSPIMDASDGGTLTYSRRYNTGRTTATRAMTSSSSSSDRWWTDSNVGPSRCQRRVDSGPVRP